jgi:ribosomal protein S18 acetylase RimI-like enzyme
MMSGRERAGFMLYGIENHRFLPRTTGMIYEVYVAPQHRRKGIARICARQAIAELRSFCPSKLQLETVEGNEKANSLWQSMGFRRVSERFVLQDGRP